MVALAYALIVLGFLGGAFVASLDPLMVNWTWFAGPVVGGIVGVVMLRRGKRQAASASERLEQDIGILEDSLNNIVANLETLAANTHLPVYEARFEIDRLFRKDLIQFVDARESVIHRHGLKAYADLMSAFAAGERYINRVWSASTDGYVDEVRAYLDRAHTQFIEAQSKFAALKSRQV
ncbi:MAG: hypothetical protein QNJ40_04870 [Xanthomonadales bacterium]|nr:hypothetical protein [Xanthomonadales bacterium]